MKKPHSKTPAKLALAATILGIPAIGATQEASAQPKTSTVVVRYDTTIRRAFDTYLKIEGTASIIGLDSGRIVYKNARGQQFYLDPRTGDIVIIKRTVTPLRWIDNKDLASKHPSVGQKLISPEKNVTIVGLDPNGNLLHRTKTGHMFILDNTTGDIVYILDNSTGK